ncbi:MAG: hypothetical protein DSZ28_09685 [Thiothrix sp.]|nr:MAG: hypothetical protein DSZ28_09685 [Thiothrix sp.]
MKYYFKLQYQILNRMLSESHILSDIGVNPSIAFIAAIITFAFLSVKLFNETAYAEYIYSFTAAYYIYIINEINRNDFLRQCFSAKVYYKVKVLENIIISLPFLLCLIYERAFSSAFYLIGFSVALSFIKVRDRFFFVIPTPFFRYPFEFTAGFRKSILLYLLTCFIAFKAVEVGNPYLGPISIAFVIVICLSYYLENERELFVWMYAVTTKKFLLNKISIGLFYFTILSAPILIPMLIYFPEKYGSLLGIQVLGYLIISTMVLIKYSAYPEGWGLLHGVVFSLAAVFPMMLLFFVPLFYSQSLRRLKLILNDTD